MWINAIVSHSNVCVFQVIKSIPKGLPRVTLPSVEYMMTYISEGITLGIVSYIFLVMMARTFAQSDDYEIDTNQVYCRIISPVSLGLLF